MKGIPRILQPQDTYVIEYPVAIEIAEEQESIFWTSSEPDVEKDLHDLRTNFSPAELHGVISTLKLFTLYERRVGEDYWSGFVAKVFKRPEIIRMATLFAMFETNVHAPFYNRVNEVLGLDNEDFYNEYLDDPILKNRMDWIGRQTVVDDTTDVYKILKSLGVFSMIEGSILYSSFSFLKHFQSEGKNKLINTNAGIDFSVRDENIHSGAGAWLFRTLLMEAMALGFDRYDELKEDLIQTGKVIVEHEAIINIKIFENGNIPGITEKQMNHFIESRVDLCLDNLGIGGIFKPSYNPIAKWFYNNINSAKLHDFFAKQGNEYNRKWNKKRFIW